MKICLVHNAYGKFSGEEAVVEGTCRLLVEHGHELLLFTRSSAEIPKMRFGKIRAFLSGIYSLSSKKAMRRLLAECKPDIVHIHNVFHLISPSVLGECRKAGVPVVMTVHNYRLVCPNGLHMVAGRVCEKCRGGKEYWCVLQNCEGSLFKSLGYALHTYTARKFRLFADNVTMFVPLTEFHRNRLISDGIPPERIIVIPNMVSVEHEAKSHPLGEYVAFVGRVSAEKGVRTLITAVQKCPDIPFRIAGNYERMPHVLKKAPGNCTFVGHLTGTELEEFYNSSRIIVMPSIWFETFGLCLVEAMVRQKPTVSSRIGALAEVVDEGITGLAFEPGNAEELADKICYLWDRPDLCREIGQAGREKALREYSPDKYYKRLMAVYEKAIELGPGGLNHNS
jgi:glycosyltransferase involved in cell wall biosynthesis